MYVCITVNSFLEKDVQILVKIYHCLRCHFSKYGLYGHYGVVAKDDQYS